jgi:hypothetical protein
MSQTGWAVRFALVLSHSARSDSREGRRTPQPPASDAAAVEERRARAKTRYERGLPPIRPGASKTP